MSPGDLLLEEAKQGVAHPLFLARFSQHQRKGFATKNRIGSGQQIDGGVGESVQEISPPVFLHPGADGIQGAGLGTALEFPEKIFPGGKMGVDRRPRHAGLAGDVLDANRSKPRIGDLRQGDLEYPVAGGEALASPKGEGFGVGGRFWEIGGRAGFHGEIASGRPV